VAWRSSRSRAAIRSSQCEIDEDGSIIGGVELSLGVREAMGKEWVCVWVVVGK
jgi:hypothetical protein